MKADSVGRGGCWGLEASTVVPLKVVVLVRALLDCGPVQSSPVHHSSHVWTCRLYCVESGSGRDGQGMLVLWRSNCAAAGALGRDVSYQSEADRVRWESVWCGLRQC